MERGVPIRSISRCIAVLQAINRHGSLSLMEIARSSQLPYPTACRIMQTLLHEGLIECEPTRKRYRATGLVHTLSQGFRNEDDLVTQARGFIVALTRKHGWPVALTTRVGQSMVIRDNTQDLTALTSDLYPPGFTMPLLECASGLAYVAHLEADERARVVEAAADSKATRRSAPQPGFDERFARIRDDGYAAYERVHDSTQAGRMSSIAVPLRDDTRLVGALSLIFFSSSMRVDDAVARYLPDLKATAASIAEAFRVLRSAPGHGEGRATTGAPPTSRANALPA